MPRIRFFAAFLLMALLLAFLSSNVYGQDPQDSLTARLLAQSEGSQIAYHNSTGFVRFYSLSDQAITASLAAQPTSEEAVTVSAKFLGTYGPLFGLTDPARELTLTGQSTADKGRTVLRYQQEYQGVPVIAGDLIVQLAGGKVLSASGEIAPIKTADVQPSLSAEAAVQIAVNMVSTAYTKPSAVLAASTPALWLYYPALLDDGDGPARLVWRCEVTVTGDPSIRELVLVDARLGAVALHFNQVDAAKNRQTYNANNSNSLPGTLARSEGQAATGITDIDNAHDYAGDVYDFYWNHHARDSIDGAGMSIISSANYYDSTVCPNAFWNGSQMVYCAGMPVDDVVGHELTHGVTQYTSGLFYMNQSGAINESLSDIWGEWIDLGNGKGTDTSGVRWLVGEDLSGGAIRNMSTPTAYSDPDRITSSYYVCGRNDNGGVHTNSGVLNKAAYLLTDGGSFNGVTITGLGIDKTATIFYELQKNFLVTGSDYNDLYNLLPQACTVLVGTHGITTSDCQQVSLAVQATEMNLQPTNCAITQASTCPGGSHCEYLFQDNLENTSSGNWLVYSVSGTAGWYYPQTSNPYSFDATYAKSGSHNFWGYDQSAASDSVIAMTSSIALPAGQTAYLRFNHVYDFEKYNGYYCDGGIVEYSTNGGASWNDVSSLPNENGYNGYVGNGSCGSTSLTGRNAYVGFSNGYTSARYNLGALAGQNVRFRFRISTDSSNAVTYYGWFIDDITIFTCTAGDATSTPIATPTTATPSYTATPTTSVTPTVPSSGIKYNYLPFMARNVSQLRQPNDPYYSQQWGYNNINMPKAWGISTGSGSPIIAVLDTGTDLDHPDLQGNLVTGYDFVNGDSSPDDDSLYYDGGGHGTHVSGTVGAIGNNRLGVTGMTWQARIMPVKVLNYDGDGWTSDIGQGIYYAVDHGAKIISLSLGGTSSNTYLAGAVQYAVNHGVIVVAAAGNNGSSTLTVYPAAYPGVVGVGATDSNNVLASFSNRGSYVDLVAPGVRIMSTLPNNGYTSSMSGTSMATPHVSGLAALIWAANPSFSAQQVINVMFNGAKDLGVAGRDNSYGYGLIDAGRCLTETFSLTAAVAATDEPMQAQEQATAPFRAGVVMVELADSRGNAAIEKVSPWLSLQAQAVDPHLPGLMQLAVTPGQEQEIVSQLLGQPGIQDAYLDYLMQAM